MGGRGGRAGKVVRSGMGGRGGRVGLSGIGGRGGRSPSSSEVTTASKRSKTLMAAEEVSALITYNLSPIGSFTNKSIILCLEWLNMS